MIKRTLHNFLHHFGFDVVRYPPPAFKPRSLTADRRIRWIKATEATLILDVGANAGQYARDLRGDGFTGRIASFEPIAAAFKELSAAAASDPLWECHQLGLGEESGSATIHIAGNNAESSSLLPMCARHVEAYPSSRYIADENIKIETVDSLKSIILPSDRVWMKLDVQGYELPILKGAVRTLKQVVGLEVELSLVPLYEGQPLIHDTLSCLGEMGFTLVSTEEVFVEAAGGRVMQLNGVFEPAVPSGLDFSGTEK